MSFCSDAFATKLPDEVKRYIKIYYPKYEILKGSYAVGDLDGDEVPDVAVMLNYYSESDYHVRLLVLKGMKDHTFETLAISKPLNPPQHGTDLEIQKRSLFVHIFLSGDGSIYSFYKFQFQYRNSNLMLIGSEISGEAQVDITQDLSYMDEYESINYLTGDRITTYKRKGKIKKIVKDKIHSKPLVKLEDWSSY